MFYLDLFRRLEEQQVRYLLVGGLAMNLHGVPRMTMDVDIALVMDRSNIETFVELAKENGFSAGCTGVNRKLARYLIAKIMEAREGNVRVCFERAGRCFANRRYTDRAPH